ncbi:N-terminal phage integrase SAM-like domain-containing protein [Streptomyces sp. NPDC050315]|uniref:N-terminal phage integrase SAM-like domain-containing protein n=1 Tax=Streptomyces sp. NPDC050315 TaxID=3155039 RepID=UPI00343DE8AE
MAPRPPERGRLYRRCGCRRPDGRQFGASCPKLKGRSRHGSWAFAVDLPSADGTRRPLCRSGFPTRKAAYAALERALRSERTGLNCDDDLTVAGYLTEWLRTKQETLRPTTFVRYRDHVHNDLLPAFGRTLLADLRPRHITVWREAEVARGRGRTAIYRIGATLSSAPGDRRAHPLDRGQSLPVRGDLPARGPGADLLESHPGSGIPAAQPQPVR